MYANRSNNKIYNGGRRMSKKELLKIIEDAFKEYPNSQWKYVKETKKVEITIQFNLEEEE